MRIEKPLRVLHIVTKMDAAGIETFLMNIYRKIDREKIQFDFLTHRDEEGFYDDEIKKMGGRIFSVPSINPFHHSAYIRALDEFFKENRYQIVHSHINSFSMYTLRSAKKMGVPIRIAHSHNTAFDFDHKYIFKEYCRKRLNKYPTHRFACSEEAGVWLFQGEEFQVINNGIDLDKFYFNSEIREKKREVLGIKDELVVGNVASFTDQKNHSFLLDVFNQFLSKNQNAKLLLIGKGPLQLQIEEKIKQYKIEDKVIILQDRKDISELMNAMDVFLFPSKYEGLGIVGIEAATNGLPVVISENLPQELNVTEKIYRISLNESAQQWSERLFSIVSGKKSREYFDKTKLLERFDSDAITLNLYNFYMKQFQIAEGEKQ